MAKRKVGWPRQSNNNMGAQSGVNLTGATVSSQSRELETSSVADGDTTTTPPPAGGGWQTGAQEFPSTSDVEIEYNIIPPDKGRGKAVPDNTAQGGSGHDSPREWERMSCLLRWNKSNDRLQSHSVCHRLITRSDDQETWDELTSEVYRVAKCLAETMAEAIRKEEGRTEMQASIASLNQCINTLRKSYQKQGETSHSRDSRSQTHHTRNDESGLPPRELHVL